MRITRVCAHRLFHDFSWSSDPHDFSLFNPIHVWNGCASRSIYCDMMRNNVGAILTVGSDVCSNGDPRLTLREVWQ
jgi:hypothetical protein